MQENNFVGYEYRKLTIDSEMETMYIDGYQNFGWEFVSGNTEPPVPAGKVILEFRRNREIPHRAEISRLQRKFDACVENIASMERRKKVPGIIVGIEIGSISCFIFVRAIMAFTTPDSNILLGILLGATGWGGSIAAYFAATVINRRREEKLEPSIDRTYEEAFAFGKEASELLNEKTQSTQEINKSIICKPPTKRRIRYVK